MSQLIRFNNGVSSSGGLDFSFARDQATYDSRGNACAADVPRYGRQRAVTTRQQASTLKAMSGSGTLGILASGVKADGVTPLVMGRTVGAANSYKVFSGDALDQSDVISGTLDLMEDTIDLESQDATHAWSAGIVCHGLIAAAAEVTYTGGPGGLCSLITSDESSNFETWTRAGVVAGDQWATDSNYPDPINAGTASWGNKWVCNWFPEGSSSNPTAIWITMTDYLGGTDGKDGGKSWICRATRTGASATSWTIGNLREVYTSTATGSGGDGEHYHACGMMQDPSTGIWYAIILIGDTDYARLVKVQIGSSDGTDYETATLTTVTDWSGGTANDGSDPETIQPTACAILADGSLLVTSDNEGFSKYIIDSDSLTSAKAKIDPAGPAGYEDDTSRGCLDLEMVHARDAYGDLYIGTHSLPDTDTPETNQQSVVASLDGRTWFTLANDQDVRYPAGKYIVGCTDGSNIIGYARPTAATVRTCNPLQINPGATNLIPATWESALTDNAALTAGTGFNQAGYGAVIYKIVDTGSGLVWPTGFTYAGETMPTPPGYEDGKLILACKTVSGVTTNEHIWKENITSSGTVAKCFTAWTHVPVDAKSIGFKTYSNVAGESSSYRRHADATGWTPYTQWNTGAEVLTNIVRLLSGDSGGLSFGEFAVMFDAAALGRIPPYPTAYGTSSPPNEVATVTGLNVTSGEDYAVSLDVLFPDHHGPYTSLGPLFTLYEDATNYVTVSIVDSPSGGAADGFPFDLEIDVTEDGSSTKAYIDEAASHLPGSAMRITVAREGSDTKLYYQANEVAQQSVTVSSAAIDVPVSVKLASDDDGTNVNALEFAGVTAADTVADAEDGLLSDTTTALFTSIYKPRRYHGQVRCGHGYT
jgi:hypothetical protein